MERNAERDLSHSVQKPVRSRTHLQGHHGEQSFGLHAAEGRTLHAAVENELQRLNPHKRISNAHEGI